MHVPSMTLLLTIARTVILAGALCAVHALPATAADSEDVWPRVRAGLFGDRPIADAGFALALAVPKRAEDAAVVPIAIHAFPAEGRGAPRKLYLIIDGNPSPVSAVFELGEAVGRAEIATRVRVEDNSTVRLIAEEADGSLSMTTRTIKASGGCSAPANKREGDANLLGQMRWLLPESVVPGESTLVTLLIRHPNRSGLAMDQLTRLYEPPHFVRQVKITYAGQTVLSADVDFSISENPAFRFAFKPSVAGALAAEVIDSNDLVFESSVDIRPTQP